MDSTAVKQLAGHSIRPRTVIDNCPFEADATSNMFGECCDSDVVTSTDVHVRLVGVLLEKMDACVREIINVEELTPRRAAPPDHHLGRAGHFGLVKAAQQSRR